MDTLQNDRSLFKADPYHYGARATCLEHQEAAARAAAKLVKGRERTLRLRLADKYRRRRHRLVWLEAMDFDVVTQREVAPVTRRPPAPVTTTPPVTRPPARPAPTSTTTRARAPRRAARKAVVASKAGASEDASEPPHGEHDGGQGLGEVAR